MEERKYEILLNKEIIARDLDLTNAMIFVKAMFVEYCNDNFQVSIRKTSLACKNDCE